VQKKILWKNRIFNRVLVPKNPIFLIIKLFCVDNKINQLQLSETLVYNDECFAAECLTGRSMPDPSLRRDAAPKSDLPGIQNLAGLIFRRYSSKTNFGLL
jgi:hypothetical protein